MYNLQLLRQMSDYVVAYLTKTRNVDWFDAPLPNVKIKKMEAMEQPEVQEPEVVIHQHEFPVPE